MEALRFVVFAFLALAAGPALAQSLEPGQWQFDTLMTMAGAKPQTGSVQRCVTKDEAADVESWAGRQLAQSDCRMAMKRKSASRASWTLECPKSGMRGTGSAILGRGTMESEQQMSGAMNGRPFEMHVKTIGKRLGPCKS